MKDLVPVRRVNKPDEKPTKLPARVAKLLVEEKKTFVYVEPAGGAMQKRRTKEITRAPRPRPLRYRTKALATLERDEPGDEGQPPPPDLPEPPDQDVVPVTEHEEADPEEEGEDPAARPGA